MVALLAGCQSGETGDTAGNTGGTEQEGSGLYTETGSYPILTEGSEMTISVFAPLRQSTTSYDASENLATEWLEETTGLTFSFETSLEVDAKQKLNTIMVGGDYPDILLFGGNSPMSLSEQLLYGSQGDFIPVNDLIDNYMPNLKALLDANPHIREAMTLSDGNMYTVPFIGKATHAHNPKKMWINQTWLDNLGLPMPTTTQEFYDTMLAFKEQDANGNGDPNDEIPLSGSLVGWNTDPTVFLMNAFGMFNQTNDNQQGVFIDENGMIAYPKVTDEWKAGLEYMNSLYDAGLLDQLTFTQTDQDLLKIGNNPDVNILGACAGGSIASFVSLGDPDRWKEYVAVPPLEGPDGFRQTTYEADFGRSGMAITANCPEENYEAIARAFDLFYTEEGVMWNRQGVEGVDYTIAEEGDVNYIGEPAKYVRVTNSAEKGNNCWSILGATGIPADHDLWYKSNGDIEEVLYNETVDKYQMYSAPIEQVLRPMALDVDQSRTIVDVEVPMSQYINQSTAEFVTGIKDIDAEWETYLSDVEAFGLSDYLAVYQEAYDAAK